MSGAFADGEPVLDWQERGDLVQVLPLLDGGLRVAAMVDGQHGPVDLSPRACEALTHGLDAWAQGRGFVPEEVHEAVLERLGHAEEQLDREQHELIAVRRQLREAVEAVEQHKTALDLADRRARGLELDVERMRAAGLPS